jgi:hypothetical protein
MRIVPIFVVKAKVYVQTTPPERRLFVPPLG